jgi:hypothetical protein
MALNDLITWFDSCWLPSFEVLTPRTNGKVGVI